MLTKSKPEEAKELWKLAQHDAEVRYQMYEYLSQRKFEKAPDSTPAAEAKREETKPVPAETTK
jgi:hypothetical protein